VSVPPKRSRGKAHDATGAAAPSEECRNRRKIFPAVVLSKRGAADIVGVQPVVLFAGAIGGEWAVIELLRGQYLALAVLAAFLVVARAGPGGPTRMAC